MEYNAGGTKRKIKNATLTRNPQPGGCGRDGQVQGMGVVWSDEGEKSIAVSFIRRTLPLAAIRAQSHSLLGRPLLWLGRGTAEMGRRKEALEL